MAITVHSVLVLVGMFVICGSAIAAEVQGDAKRGAQAYKTCVACHSLEPGRHFTEPSLANLYGRKAGTASNFLRYSDALRRSGIL